MAHCSILSIIIKFFVIILSISLNNNTVMRGMKVGAQLLVEPLWDMSTDGGNPCSFDTISTEGWILHGSKAHSCSLQVNATQGTHIQLLIPGSDASQKHAFVYIERNDLEYCPNKYIAYREQPETCMSVLLSRNVQFILQGNTSIFLTKIPGSESMSICPESVDSFSLSKSVSQVTDCKDVKGYNDKITCDHGDPKAGRCILKFPTNCNATLGYNEVLYENCDFDMAQHPAAIIIYPSNTRILYLSYNNIVKINTYSFQHVNGLQGLYLSGNFLSKLHDGIFWGLQTLTTLDLSWNYLEILKVQYFEGLDELRYLRVQSNKLKTLPVSVFHSLINLEKLIASGNEIILLDVNSFMQLDELKHLKLDNNMLRVLPKNIFMGLNDIDYLVLSHNLLKRLQTGLFQVTKKLQELLIDNNLIEVLDEELFRGLGNLTYLFLENNMLTSLPNKLFHGLANLNALSNLITLNLANNMLKSLPNNLFQGLTNLNVLKIATNQVTNLNKETFEGLTHLQALFLQGNVLRILGTKSFNSLVNLQCLYLFNNAIVKLDHYIFRRLNKLQILRIQFNQLEILDKYLFQDLKNLSLLSLEHNYITHVDRHVFKYTFNLRFIDLSSNKLIEIPNFQYLIYLNYLDIRNNTFVSIFDNTFSALSKGSKVFASQHEVCECYVPKYVNCSAADKRSPYLTCDRLLSNIALVIVMWLIGLNAIGGNIFVFLWQMRHTRQNKVFTLLLCNLAASDFLMGIYMVIITSADLYFGYNFPMQSEAWRSGIICRIAGALSIISSEASVFFVMIISIDRFISIRFPLSTKKLGKQSIIVIVVFAWVIAFLLGTVPSVLSGVKFEFYDNSHVCVGLPLSLTKTYITNHITNFKTIKYEYVWLFFNEHTFITHYNGSTHGLFFSTAVFIGLNSICYLIILGCYIEIVRAVRRSSKRAGRSLEMQQQIKLTTKVTAIVVTDFCCWFPVIVLGILVQLRVITLPPSVYAWCVTFVLPINSAINPYLYTVTEIVSEKRKKRKEENDNKKLIEMFQLRNRTKPGTSNDGQ